MFGDGDARDRYFKPVIAELKPLLKLLWPDADLKFDGDSILPTALIRDGQEESIGALSGGTQEQIALLVRLAFARLLASGGRHAPIILDDALVGVHLDAALAPVKRKRKSKPNIFDIYLKSKLRLAGFCSANNLDPTCFQKELVEWRSIQSKRRSGQ